MTPFAVCLWYSFDSADNFCAAYATCENLNDCATCVSGEVTCPDELCK